MDKLKNIIFIPVIILLFGDNFFVFFKYQWAVNDLCHIALIATLLCFSAKFQKNEILKKTSILISVIALASYSLQVYSISVFFSSDFFINLLRRIAELFLFVSLMYRFKTPLYMVMSFYCLWECVDEIMGRNFYDYLQNSVLISMYPLICVVWSKRQRIFTNG